MGNTESLPLLPEPAEINECSDEDRYKQLSFQLFGIPGPGNWYKGPIVCVESLDEANSGNRNIPKFKLKKPRDNVSKLVGSYTRCLVCYSIISRNDEEPVMSTSTMMEKSENVIELIRILASRRRRKRKNLGGPKSLRVSLERAIERISTGPAGCFCTVCNAACDLLFSKLREIKRLQQESNELQQKFIAAIKLSQELSEQNSNFNATKSKNNQEKYETELKDKRGNMKDVDMIRKWLLIGNRTVLGVQRPPKHHADDFKTELNRDPEPLDFKSDQFKLSALAFPDEYSPASSSSPPDIKPEIDCESSNVKTTTQLVETADTKSVPGSFHRLNKDIGELLEGNKDDFEGGHQVATATCSRLLPLNDPVVAVVDGSEPTSSVSTSSFSTDNPSSGKGGIKRKQKRYDKEYRRRIKEKFPGMKWKEARKEYTKSLFKEKLPTKGGEGNGVGISLWTKRDGKLYFRDVLIEPNSEGNYVCPYNCSQFGEAGKKDKNVLARHINKYHVDLSQAYKCEQCDSRFYYNYDLIRHKEERHGGGYQCELCGERLSNRNNLHQHKRVKHQGIKPHKCEQCGKGFASRKDRDIHVRRHTGEKPFACHICPESFVDKPSLKTHFQRKHPEQQESTRQESAV